MKLTTISAILFLTLFTTACGENENSETNETTAKIESSDATTPVTPTSDKTVITGTMLNGAGTTIKMYSYSANMPTAIDSATVDADGNFSFTKPQNGFDFVGIGESPNSAGLVIVNGGEDIELSGSKENWVKDYLPKGSSHSIALKEYFAKRQAYSNEIQKLKLEIQSLGNSNPVAVEAINQQGMAMQTEFDVYKYDFINKNINSPAVYAAFQDIYDLEKDENILKDMSATMSKFMPNSVFAQAVEQKYLQAKQQGAAPAAPTPKGALTVGSVAPELNFPGLDGKNISLHSLKGKVVLLDFWASWCGPCRKENPNVVKLYNEYKDKGFTVYSYSLDQDKNKWMNAIQADGLIWPNHVSDLKGWNAAGGAIYGVNSIPQTYLIGADGKIIASGLRGIELENKLKEILG